MLTCPMFLSLSPHPDNKEKLQEPMFPKEHCRSESLERDSTMIKETRKRNLCLYHIIMRYVLTWFSSAQDSNVNFTPSSTNTEM